MSRLWNVYKSSEVGSNVSRTMTTCLPCRVSERAVASVLKVVCMNTRRDDLKTWSLPISLSRPQALILFIVRHG